MNEPTLHLTVGIKLPRAAADRTAKSRPTFSLPWSVTPDRLPPGRDFSIRLIARARILERADDAGPSVDLTVRGRTYRFPRAMRAILDALSDREPRSFDRVVEACALDEDTVRLLLAMLVKDGLIALL
jgi:hypothetical protein